MKKIFTIFMIYLLSISSIKAQWSGVFTDDAYLKGTKTEVGISNCGSFGSRVVPALILGYHPNVAGRGLGFTADAGSNGWSIAGPGGLPPYCGDYFLPGSPVEGFAVQIGMTNYRNFNSSGICDFFNIPGGMICYSSTLDRTSATWQSTGLVGGALRVTNTTYVPDTSLFFVTQVKLCNESASPVNDVYYLRHLDPDNDQPWSAYLGSFTTRNQTYSQGSDTTPGLVTATSRSGCYLGLGSESPTSRVTMGGFAPPTLSSDVWNGIAPYNATVGRINNADEAISIAFKFLTIPPGTCECFGYAHVLNLSDLNRALALTASHVAVYEDTVNITDTLTKVICLGDSVKLKAVTTCTDFYAIHWEATPPGSIIGSPDLDSLIASPSVTTIYTLTGIGPCGADTFNITVIVDTFITTLSLSPIDTTICQGASVVLDVIGTGTYTYTWSPGTGLSSTSSGSPTASPSGTTIYSVTVTSTLAGCKDTLYTIVHIDTLIATAGRDSSICPGRTMILGGSPTSSLGYPVAWSSVPLGGLSYLSSPSDTNPTLVFPLGEPAGSFTYILLSFNYGCINRDTIVVSVSASPPITIGLDSIYCVTSPNDIITCTPYGGTLSGPGIIDSTFHPSIAGIGGPYKILYSFMTPSGCISVDSAFTVVDSFPLARFIGLSSNYCVADSSAILVGAPGGGLFSGPGIIGNRFYPSLAGIGGPYNIRYTYTNPISGCVDDTIQTVTIIALPLVSFIGLDTQYCLSGINYILIGSPSGGVFSGSSMVDSIYTPSRLGIDTIIYTYSSGINCTNSDTQYTNVRNIYVNFTGLDSQYCIYDYPSTLIGSPSGGVFSGSGISGNTFYPDSTDIDTIPMIVYSYTDTITGCSNSDTQYTNINQRPLVNLTGLNFKYCINDTSILLSGNPSGGVFAGSGVSGNAFSPNLAGVGGIYSITYGYIDLITGCFNSDTLYTNVYSLPISNAGNDDTICKGQNITLRASGGINYSWSNDSLTQSIIVSPISNTSYSVSVSDSNGCVSTDSVLVNVNNIYSELLGKNVTCYGYNDGISYINIINGGSAPYTYSWSDPSHRINDTLTNLSPGSYYVTITDLNGCYTIDTIVIDEPSQLIGNVISTSSVLCYGDSNGSAKFSASGGFPLYLYNTTLDSIHYYYGSNIYNLSPGTYWTNIIDANGCISNIKFDINQPTPIDINYQIFQPRCYGYNDGSIFISVFGGSPSYTIQLDDKISYSGWFTNLSYGNHTLTIMDTNGCLKQSNLFLDQPNPIIVDINPDSLFLELGESGQLFTTFSGAPADSVIFQWITSDGLSCSDCPNPFVNTYIDQTYQVTVIDVSDPFNMNPCIGTAIGYVFISDGGPIYIPNAFIPNNDGVNDFFRVYGKNLKYVQMQIFDRWGELLFESYSQDNGWDGTYKETMMQPGVYVYKVNVEYLNGIKMDKTGSVTLIR